ncbi:Uncharacterised protein [Turicibacter sanguinis]|nr:Uncharacterised protein [Turicibacter sanguinis]
MVREFDIGYLNRTFKLGILENVVNEVYEDILSYISSTVFKECSKNIPEEYQHIIFENLLQDVRDDDHLKKCKKTIFSILEVEYENFEFDLYNEEEFDIVVGILKNEFIQSSQLVRGKISEYRNKIENYIIFINQEISPVEKINQRIESIISECFKYNFKSLIKQSVLKESIVKYVRFYFWITQIQENNNVISLLEANKRLIETYDLSYIEDDTQGNLRDKFFDRGVDQYNNINTRTRIDYENVLKTKKRRENENVFLQRAIPFLEINLDTYYVVREIKEKGFQNEDDPFLKELNSYLNKMNINRKNCNLSNINYTNMQTVYEHLRSRIEELNLENISLHIYQIEKSIPFSLISEMMRQCYSFEDEKEIVAIFNDLVLLFTCPLIDIRQNYIPMYLQLNEREKEDFINEIILLNLLIANICRIVLSDSWIEVEIQKIDMKKLNCNCVADIYTLDMFNNSCKKFDYKKKHFNLLMRAVQTFNQQIDEQNRKCEIE